MSKRKDRKRYNNGSRQDYTKGGRVGYREGDEVEERNARAEAIANNRDGVQNQQSGEGETVNTTPQGNNTPMSFEDFTAGQNYIAQGGSGFGSAIRDIKGQKFLTNLNKQPIKNI
jgi:hypothetical protein